MLIAGTGNPALDAALGTVVSRGPDRKPKDQGGGVQLRSSELGGDLRAKLGIYAGRFSVAETLASATVGSVFGPPGNFAATSRYFIEHPGKVPLLGFSLVMHPSASNQLRLDYSVRRNNPLQIDDREMIGAVQLIGACAATGDPALCGAASQNRVVRRQTGAVALTQVAAIGLSGADISGVSRHDLGQWIVGFTQGLPNVLGSKLVLLDFEHVAQSISGYDASLLPLRADRGVASGAVASKTAALYRIGLKMDWGPTALANTHSVFAQFQRDYHGRAATPRDIAFAGRRSLTLGGSMDFAKNWSAHAVWIGQLGRGTEADTEHDRRVLNLGLSYKF